MWLIKNDSGTVYGRRESLVEAEKDACRIKLNSGINLIIEYSQGTYHKAQPWRPNDY